MINLLPFCSILNKPALIFCFLAGFRTLASISPTDILIGSGLIAFRKDYSKYFFFLEKILD